MARGSAKARPINALGTTGINATASSRPRSKADQALHKQSEDRRKRAREEQEARQERENQARQATDGRPTVGAKSTDSEGRVIPRNASRKAPVAKAGPAARRKTGKAQTGSGVTKPHKYKSGSKFLLTSKTAIILCISGPYGHLHADLSITF